MLKLYFLLAEEIKCILSSTRRNLGQGLNFFVTEAMIKVFDMSLINLLIKEHCRVGLDLNTVVDKGMPASFHLLKVFVVVHHPLWQWLLRLFHLFFFVTFLLTEMTI